MGTSLQATPCKPSCQGTIAALCREWVGVALEQIAFVITTIGTIGPDANNLESLEATENSGS